MSTISASTTSTTAYKVTADTTGTLVLQTGATPTTAVTIGTDQSVTLAGTLAVQSQNISPYTGFKNRIINGAMVIDQRNAGASVTQTTSGLYCLDRWQIYGSAASKFTVQQSSTAPAGFVNSALITSSSAYTVGSGEFFVFQQAIEGLNLADLGWGTANAQPITLSFKVRSSLTGTFGGAITNSANNRSYPFTFTISSANTYEDKTVTIAGDTSGTWLTTNGIGLTVRFSLGTGSTYSGTAGSWAGTLYTSATGATSVVGTNGATFYITGVQLEKGSTATSFDYRPYGTELALCQRYYYKQKADSAYWDFGVGWTDNSTAGNCVSQFPVQMRTAPTSLEQSGTASHYQVVYASAGTNCSAVPTFAIASTWNARTQFTVASGLTAGQGCGGRAANTTSAYLAWSAEL